MNMTGPASDAIEFSTFYVGDALCGINILNIQEINRLSTITKIPQSGDYIRGIINLRGRIVTIIDLGRKLELAPVHTNNRDRNIIVDSGDEQIGLLVDSISDVIRAGTHEIEPAPANLNGIKGRYFKGVLKTEDQLVGILDINRVLS